MLQQPSNFVRAVAWFVLCLSVGCLTNAMLKYLGNVLNPGHVTFYRCFFATITLFPVVFYRGITSLSTPRLWLHVVRGGLFAIAMDLWSRGIAGTPIATATLVSFTTPIFVLLLAPLFLQEQVTWPIWMATLLSFVGVGLVLRPDQDPSPTGWWLVLASALFGLLDVLNKKQVQEGILPMIFYSACFATLCLAPPVLAVGALPTYHVTGWLLGLGIANNLLLYCLLRAFSLASASSLAPFRYLELPISIVVGYILFQELPESNVYLGASIIVPCTLFVLYYERTST